METEILRGANVRITTESARVGTTLTPIAGITDAALTEADHRIRRLPAIFFFAGPILAAAIQIVTGQFVTAGLACLAVMGVGGVFLRDSWLHQVTARFSTGRSRTLYRTQRLGDAKLFHAALQKALELRQAPPQP